MAAIAKIFTVQIRWLVLRLFSPLNLRFPKVKPNVSFIRAANSTNRSRSLTHLSGGLMNQPLVSRQLFKISVDALRCKPTDNEGTGALWLLDSWEIVKNCEDACH